jgi:phage major head subunit gpT-like protein
MGTASLGSRAIIGRFYQTLEQGNDAYVNALAMAMNSDQASEEYKWLGMAPAMREWIGGREAKGFRENGLVVPNKKYEATLRVSVDDLRRDKTSQIMLRVDEMADRANRFKGKLISDKIIAGESAACYDGQYFFDTDHSEGDSGSQSNDISVTISGLPVTNKGTTTAPSAGTLAHVIGQSIQQILSFKDDQGEPMNEGARSFLVMVPVPFWMPAMAAVGQKVQESSDNVLGTLDGFSIQVVANPRLTWTTKLATFRTDGRAKPFIMQEELPVQVAAVAEDSELEFREDVHDYGVKWQGAAAYGYWQHACLATLA